MTYSESIIAKYTPLSFINNKSEIDLQIENTIIFKTILQETREITILGELIKKTQYGYTAKALEDGNCKLVRITDLKAGRINWEQVPYCDCDRIEKYKLNINDILIARTGGTTGKSYIVNENPFPAIFASYLIRLTPNPDILPEYIHSFLNSYYFWNQIIELKSGAAQPNVNAEKMKNLKIPVCPYDLQKDIWKKKIRKPHYEIINKILKLKSEVCFSTGKADGLSNEITHQQTLLKKLRQSILQDAISGKLTEKWRKENPDIEPATELLAQIKAEKDKLVKEKKIKKQKPLSPVSEDEIPFELPKGWIWCRLGEIAQKIHYGFNASAKPEIKVVRLLRITDIQDNIVIWDNVPGCQYSKQDIENYLLRNGDILIARTGGTIGKSYIVRDIKVCSLFASYLIRVVPDTKNTNPDYLKLFIESPLYWKQLYEVAWGAGQPNVNGTSLSKLLLPLPSKAEQDYIITTVKKLFTYCGQLEQQINKSQQDSELLMQAVLQEAFGKN